MQVAKTEAIDKLIIMSDSQATIQKINTATTAQQAYGNLVKACQILLNAADWSVQITHCYREAIKGGDFLANLVVD